MMDVFSVANLIVFFSFVVMMALTALALRLLRPPRVEEAPLVEEVSTPRLCPTCGDDLDAPVHPALETERAEGIAAVLNSIPGVIASVHMRSGGLCFAIFYRKSEISRKDFARIRMLGWQTTHPDETVYFTGNNGVMFVLGPMQEVQ